MSCCRHRCGSYAARVLRYVTRIWDQYEREHPKARRLPAVIPLVVYQGPGRWTSPVQLLDVIDLQAAREGHGLVLDPRTAEQQVHEDLGLPGTGLIR